MAKNEHVKKYCATCETTLQLTKPSGRIVVADSWFSSVKMAIALLNVGVYSDMQVKITHLRYPRDLLDTHMLQKGEWVAYTAEIDGVPLMAVNFHDIIMKQFISICSTVV